MEMPAWDVVWPIAQTLESATSEAECRALHEAAAVADAHAGLWHGMTGKTLHAVEIGTWCGRTAVCIEAALQRMPLTTIDRFQSFVDVCGNLTRPPSRMQVMHLLHERRASRVTVLQGDSPAVAAGWDKQVGFLFIDGDHGETGPSSDWIAWRPHLHPGALICWHDYIPGEPHGPYRAVAQTINRLLGDGTLHEVSRAGTLIVTSLAD